MKIVSGYLVALFLLIGPMAMAQLPDAGPAPETKKCIAMRARHGVESPLTGDRVYAYSEGSELLVESYCAVAWRTAEGRWLASGIGETSMRIPGSTPVASQVTRRVLSAAEGRRMDRLMAGEAAYNQVSPPDGLLAIGEIFHTMEIDGVRGRHVIHWTRRLRGKAGQIADLVMGRG